MLHALGLDFRSTQSPIAACTAKRMSPSADSCSAAHCAGEGVANCSQRRMAESTRANALVCPRCCSVFACSDMIAWKPCVRGVAVAVDSHKRLIESSDGNLRWLPMQVGALSNQRRAYRYPRVLVPLVSVHRRWQRYGQHLLSEQRYYDHGPNARLSKRRRKWQRDASKILSAVRNAFIQRGGGSSALDLCAQRHAG